MEITSYEVKVLSTQVNHSILLFIDKTQRNLRDFVDIYVNFSLENINSMGFRVQSSLDITNLDIA